MTTEPESDTELFDEEEEEEEEVEPAEPDLDLILKDLPNALQDGQTMTLGGGAEQVVLRRRTIGELVVTSGALVACDPATLLEWSLAPFVTRVAPGTYPVILSIAENSAIQRVAYATLQVKDTAPVRWDIARFVDDDDAPGLPGYGVDSGTGCFMDTDAAHAWARRMENTDYSIFTSAIRDEMEKNGPATCSWAVVALEPETRANLIAFNSGFGDGSYVSFIGYDSQDEIAYLVTDFGLFWRSH